MMYNNSLKGFNTVTIKEIVKCTINIKMYKCTNKHQNSVFALKNNVYVIALFYFLLISFPFFTSEFIIALSSFCRAIPCPQLIFHCLWLRAVFMYMDSGRVIVNTPMHTHRILMCVHIFTIQIMDTVI